MRERPSPNHNPRNAAIDMLILHYTGMASAAAALERLCSREAQVSAHYLIDEDGTVWRLVPEELRAWHTGVAFWRGQRDINAASVGIELVNPGHDLGYRAFPEAQIVALETLCRGILARHPIPPRHVLGHSDVAPTRKQDPGELFPWLRLAEHGIGLFPALAPPVPPAHESDLSTRLSVVGYDLAEPAAAIAAFQRHYRPARIDGVADAETAALAEALAALCGGV